MELTITLDSVNYTPILLTMVEIDFDNFSLMPLAKTITDSLAYPVSVPTLL